VLRPRPKEPLRPRPGDEEREPGSSNGESLSPDVSGCREGERPRPESAGLGDREPAYESDLARILLRLCAVAVKLVL